VGARLGQHFLSDPSILGRIADAAGIRAGETVLEIGPGKGSLTRHLARRAARVVAIEADRRLAETLRRELDAPASAAAAQTEAGAAPEGRAVEIIHGDALRVPWPAAHRVCGNIPYRITSPLIERALTPPRPLCVVFLVQREVADRLAAAPGTRTYGALSAGVQLVARVERLFAVPRGAFRPSPRVDSAVVRLTPHDPLVCTPEEEASARRLIRASFQHRRQQLRRTLSGLFGVPRAEAEKLLASVGADAAARPEVLSPVQFLDLARAIGPGL